MLALENPVLLEENEVVIAKESPAIKKLRPSNFASFCRPEQPQADRSMAKTKKKRRREPSLKSPLHYSRASEGKKRAECM